MIGKKTVGTLAKTYDNRITSKITSAQDTSDTIPCKTEDMGFDGKIPKERYISSGKKQQSTDKLRLIWYIIMKYQKIINLLDNTSNQPSKKRTKNWVKISYNARGRHSINNQIKIKTVMLKSSLCESSVHTYL